jgi:hypothetical protein
MGHIGTDWGRKGKGKYVLISLILREKSKLKKEETFQRRLKNYYFLK